jgi:hypothetical protein
MSLPRWLGRFAEFETAFAAEMVALCAAAAAFSAAAAARLSRGFGRPMATAVAFAVLTLFAGPIIANRFDIAVALALAAFLYCVARRWWWVAGASLGIGFALKLTPAMFLPLVFILAPKARHIATAGVAFVVAAVLPFVPHLLRSGRAVFYIFTYHGERPLQLESLYASQFLLGHVLAGHNVVIGNSHGSQTVTAPGAAHLAALSLWLMAACISGFYVLLWRRRHWLRRRPSELAFAALGLVLTFVCTSKVLSPQFMIWTFPLVALVIASPGGGRRLVGGLLLTAVLLTQLGFPSRYWDLVALRTGPVVLVAVRNLILLSSALLVVVLTVRRPDRG